MEIRPADFVAFHRVITDYYYQSGRHTMAWRKPGPRGRFNPYHILVSELMLQQTQVARVEVKYDQFIARFPTIEALAGAPLGDVLKTWNGLGYNRRAKYLWEAARAVVQEHGGVFPRTLEGLRALPGIGPGTAGAILAYAYDQPALYVETNIRTVIIHHFFADQTGITDTQILHVLAQLLPGAHEASGATLSNRQFYWALMDYGSHLKQTTGNKNSASKSYKKQSAFHGSRRQLRGSVIKLLTGGPQPEKKLLSLLNDDRTPAVIAVLVDEGLIVRTGTKLQLAD